MVVRQHTARIIAIGHPDPQRIKRAVAFAWRLNGVTEVVVEHRDPPP